MQRQTPRRGGCHVSPLRAPKRAYVTGDHLTEDASRKFPPVGRHATVERETTDHHTAHISQSDEDTTVATGLTSHTLVFTKNKSDAAPKEETP